MSRFQAVELRGVQMQVNIDGELPKLKKSGSLRALRSITLVGKIGYKILSFSGDNTVKNDVIGKYLSADQQSQDTGDISITPANYKFKFKGYDVRNGHSIYVFDVTPRKKRVGLFKGELWVDAETCLPVRESGRFVKNPSVFLKKVEFVREYQIRDGMAIPLRIETVADTRIAGQARLTINYTNFTRQDAEAVSAAPAHNGQ